MRLLRYKSKRAVSTTILSISALRLAAASVAAKRSSLTKAAIKMGYRAFTLRHG